MEPSTHVAIRIQNEPLDLDAIRISLVRYGRMALIAKFYRSR